MRLWPMGQNVPECVILFGRLEAGKTTCYRDRFAATHAQGSKDLWPHAKQREHRQQCVLAELLAASRSVVVDSANPDPRQIRPPRRHRGAAKEDGIDCSGSYRNAPVWAVAFGSIVPNQSASVLASLAPWRLKNFGLGLIAHRA